VTAPQISRWIVGGQVTGAVEIVGNDDQVFRTQEFTLATKQQPLLTVMGAGSILLLLFSLAYLESTLRTLRRGHRSAAAPVAGGVLGLVFGLAAWLLVTVLTSHTPQLMIAVPCGILGAAAGVFAVFAARRAGQRI
jgi:serine/threonine-protein kinase